jgi:hypothetical protein
LGLLARVRLQSCSEPHCRVAQQLQHALQRRATFGAAFLPNALQSRLCAQSGEWLQTDASGFALSLSDSNATAPGLSLQLLLQSSVCVVAGPPAAVPLQAVRAPVMPPALSQLSTLLASGAAASALAPFLSGACAAGEQIDLKGANRWRRCVGRSMATTRTGCSAGRRTLSINGPRPSLRLFGC